MGPIEDPKIAHRPPQPHVFRRHRLLHIIPSRFALPRRRHIQQTVILRTYYQDGEHGRRPRGCHYICCLISECLHCRNSIMHGTNPETAADGGSGGGGLSDEAAKGDKWKLSRNDICVSRCKVETFLLSWNVNSVSSDLRSNNTFCCVFVCA